MEGKTNNNILWVNVINSCCHSFIHIIHSVRVLTYVLGTWIIVVNKRELQLNIKSYTGTDSAKCHGELVLEGQTLFEGSQGKNILAKP